MAAPRAGAVPRPPARWVYVDGRVHDDEQVSSDLIEALRAAVAAAPANVGVRLQLAEALLDGGEAEESLLHARAALSTSPDLPEALSLAARAAEALGQVELADGYRRLHAAVTRTGVDHPGDVVPADLDLEEGTDDAGATFSVERSALTLADVGGMSEVKRELRRSFLDPVRNPELRAHYGVELGGGLLVYGPPGCGKTLLGRAVAGELGAQFLSLGLHDVLDMWLGQSERRLHAAFEEARRRAPCVLFFDEIDALGQKRGQLKGHGGRNVVNQLLSEMDGLESGADDGVFVLAATNHPWDVDAALRRPGRFDRSILVLPPDRAARRAILSLHLRNRPTQNVDLDDLARRTDGYSGADLALVCRTAVAGVMTEAVEAGAPRPITGRDLEAALRETGPSTRPWFKLAYNFAAFADDGGMYGELLAYIRRHRLA